MARLTTPDRIAAAASRLLADEGADAVTMRRVATVVGITPMAIYRHFADRDALLNTLADQGFESLAARIGALRFRGSSEARLNQMADAIVDHAMEHPHLFELMFLKKRAGARQYPTDFREGTSPTASPLAALIRSGMEAGEFRDDDEWQIAFEIAALSHGLITLYLGGRIDATPQAFRAIHKSSFQRYFRGIRA